MNYYSLIAFLIIALMGGWAAYRFFRAALSNLETVAAEHAKVFAVSYIKGGSLILIAAFAAFEQSYWALDEITRATMTWAVYFIFFSKPLTGGLAVLVAFLDRSTQRASEEADKVKAKTNPPFSAPQP